MYYFWNKYAVESYRCNNPEQSMHGFEPPWLLSLRFCHAPVAEAAHATIGRLLVLAAVFLVAESQLARPTRAESVLSSS